ncbi:MAG: hypothetical protein Q8O09_03000 [Bacillota bacterium]|nr:hypothetical protein [Bacillota bacterium]
MKQNKVVIIVIAALCAAAFALQFVCIGFIITNFTSANQTTLWDSFDIIIQGVIGYIITGLLLGALAVVLFDSLRKPRHIATAALAGGLAAWSLSQVLPSIMQFAAVTDWSGVNLEWYIWGIIIVPVFGLAFGVWAAIYMGCKGKDKVIKEGACCCVPEPPKK